MLVAGALAPLLMTCASPQRPNRAERPLTASTSSLEAFSGPVIQTCSSAKLHSRRPQSSSSRSMQLQRAMAGPSLSRISREMYEDQDARDSLFLGNQEPFTDEDLPLIAPDGGAASANPVTDGEQSQAHLTSSDSQQSLSNTRHLMCHAPSAMPRTISERVASLGEVSAALVEIIELYKLLLIVLS